jgi:hypothetical protein
MKQYADGHDRYIGYPVLQTSGHKGRGVPFHVVSGIGYTKVSFFRMKYLMMKGMVKRECVPGNFGRCCLDIKKAGIKDQCLPVYGMIFLLMGISEIF